MKSKMLSLIISVGVLNLFISLSVQAFQSDNPYTTDVAIPEMRTYQFHVPVEYFTLSNGLKVVLSEDHASPTVSVGVYYDIGFRNEPRNMTGFAHLFEHMMFQGSENLKKMEFLDLVSSNGGVLNGTTRFDFTNYYEVIPSKNLETVLWAEADRMNSIVLSESNIENQKDVVKNEVKVAVQNAPYGGFPWLDMPQYAFENWHNSHNFYGDFEDLDAAEENDFLNFFENYYKPNNAVLVVVGDIDLQKTKGLVERFFSSISPGNIATKPVTTEPKQLKQKVFTKIDRLASQPAVAFAYQMPKRNTPEYYAMGLIDQLLMQGDDSQMSRIFVNEHNITGDLKGGINYLLGNMFNYKEEMLWMGSFIYNADVPQEKLIKLLDAAIEDYLEREVSKEELALAMTKIKSSFYDIQEDFHGFGKADLLACFALFDDNPNLINEVISNFEKVTPKVIKETARKYLKKDNRTILFISPPLPKQSQINAQEVKS